MEKINFYSFKGDNQEIVIITDDGGIGSTYLPEGGYLRSEYYQERISHTTTFENLWDSLGEGKLYSNDWDGEESPKKEIVDDEVIDYILNWLCYGTNPDEFIQHDCGELTEESFNNVKAKLDWRTRVSKTY